MGRRWWGTAVSLCLLAACVCQARVYQTLGSRRGGRIDPAAPGWRLAYESDLVVDGIPVGLDVFSSSRPLGQAAAALSDQLTARGGDVTVSGQGQLGWARARWDDREVRALLMAPGLGPGTILFVMYQPVGRRGQPETPRGVPLPGGLTPTRSLRNLGTDTDLYVMQFSTAPETMEARLAAGLIQDGWQPLPPPGVRGAVVGSAFYVKGRRICCISTQTGGGNGENVLTLLLRELPR